MRKLIASTLLILVVLMGFVPPAAASSRSVATGSFNYVPTTTTLIRTAGGNSYYAEVASVTWSGGLSGVATDTETYVVHADGSFSGHGTEVCAACTIGGRTGSYTARIEFAGPGASYSGRLIFHGSGGLAGLRGGGVFQGSDSGYTYSFDYWFTEDN